MSLLPGGIGPTSVVREHLLPNYRGEESNRDQEVSPTGTPLALRPDRVMRVTESSRGTGPRATVMWRFQFAGDGPPRYGDGWRLQFPRDVSRDAKFVTNF